MSSAAASPPGFVTNLETAMTIAPATLDGYRQLLKLFDTTSFTPLERQVILLAASVENGCDYCSRWHDALGRRAGLKNDDAIAMRADGVLGDARLDALRQFTVAMIVQRGRIDAATLDAFLSHGFTRQQSLEVVLGLAAKTLSNYSSALLNPEVDGVLLRSK